MALSRITSDGVAANAITTLGVANGAIITVDLADTAVTGPKLATYAVSGNNIGLGAVSGNQIGIYAVSGNQISTGSISGNHISLYAVSGNQIGLGAISSNHFAGGGITSDVLSSNLTVSTARVAETVNVQAIGISGNYQIHIANSTVYHFTANSTGNVTFQMIANTGRSVDTMMSIGQSASVAIMMKQGATRYRANIHIDGVLQTAYWAGNSQPQYTTSAGAQSMTYDAYTFSIIKIGSGQYTVFASNTQFGQANGQGMGVSTAFGPAQ
jgi:hypothetical protein